MGSVASFRLAPSDQSLGARYESLIRLADSIRAQHEPKALFRALVNELRPVIPFDAIAQCDESSKESALAFWGVAARNRLAPPPSRNSN